MRAGATPLELDRLRDAAGRLFQVQRDLAADIVPAMGAATAAPAAEKIPEDAAAKHVPERFEDVLDVVELRGAAFQARVPVPIVARPLVGIGQHLVGLRGLLEFLRGVLVARIAVRVELDGLLAIRRRNLLRRRGAGDTQYFVIVRFVSHRCHGTLATVRSVEFVAVPWSVAAPHGTAAGRHAQAGHFAAKWPADDAAGLRGRSAPSQARPVRRTTSSSPQYYVTQRCLRSASSSCPLCRTS